MQIHQGKKPIQFYYLKPCILVSYLHAFILHEFNCSCSLRETNNLIHLPATAYNGVHLWSKHEIRGLNQCSLIISVPSYLSNELPTSQRMTLVKDKYFPAMDSYMQASISHLILIKVIAYLFALKYKEYMYYM